MNEEAKKLVEKWSEHDRQIAEVEGWCLVNGVLLNHLLRYRFAQMQFCMPEREKKRIQKHLKDCPDCRAIIAKSQKERPPTGEAIIVEA